MDEFSFEVRAENTGERLDKLIAYEIENLSRSSIQKIISDGSVTVNNKTVLKSMKVKNGDVITVIVPDPVELTAIPQNIDVDIVYEDEHLLVVNKPKGMVVHPAPGNPDGTLVNALLYHCKGRLSSINGVIRPGIVHRIDKDTSGLLIVAKNDYAHTFLAEQIKEHSFTRKYKAVVIGKMPQEKGTVNAPLGRCRNDRKKQAVNGINPRNAVTHYEVIERFAGYDLCCFTLETGRTHQIRVHSSYIGHPVAGDAVYGPPKNNLGLEGQCLHAETIGFIHPATNEYMEFSAPLPDYFINTIKKISE